MIAMKDALEVALHWVEVEGFVAMFSAIIELGHPLSHPKSLGSLFI